MPGRWEPEAALLTLHNGIWNEDRLENVPGYSSWPQAISPDGDAFAGVLRDSDSDQFDSFVWSRSRGTQEISGLAGSVAATEVSNDGRYATGFESDGDSWDSSSYGTMQTQSFGVPFAASNICVNCSKTNTGWNLRLRASR